MKGLSCSLSVSSVRHLSELFHEVGEVDADLVNLPVTAVPDDELAILYLPEDHRPVTVAAKVEEGRHHGSVPTHCIDSCFAVPPAVVTRQSTLSPSAMMFSEPEKVVEHAPSCVVSHERFEERMFAALPSFRWKFTAGVPVVLSTLQQHSLRVSETPVMLMKQACVSSVSASADALSTAAPIVRLSAFADPPPSAVQVFVAVQPKRFDPAVASLSKKQSPTAHVAGAVVPTLHAAVESADAAFRLSPDAAVSALQLPVVHPQTSVMSPPDGVLTQESRGVESSSGTQERFAESVDELGNGPSVNLCVPPLGS